MSNDDTAKSSAFGTPLKEGGRTKERKKGAGKALQTRKKLVEKTAYRLRPAFSQDGGQRRKIGGKDFRFCV